MNDNALAIINADTIIDFAKYRENLHKSHASSRPLSKNYELIGLLGEFEFARVFNMPVDLTMRSDGDKGVDFVTPYGTIDVKTANKAYNLIVEVGKVNADIYVLAQFNQDDLTVKLLGWEYGYRIENCPSKDFGYGVINHYMSAQELMSISLLKTILTI